MLRHAATPAFHNWTRSTAGGNGKNIQRAIHIAIVVCTTCRTLPRPYSKPCDTSRPLWRQRTALRTGLGRESFVHLREGCRLIAQHISESRPSGVENGFRHSRLCQIFRINVPNRDERVFAGETCRKLVVKILAGIGDVTMDRRRAALIACALRDGQAFGQEIEMARVRDDLAIACGSEEFQTEIDADRTGLRRRLFDLDMEDDEPAAERILNECAALGGLWQ